MSVLKIQMKCPQNQMHRLLNPRTFKVQCSQRVLGLKKKTLQKTQVKHSSALYVTDSQPFQIVTSQAKLCLSAITACKYLCVIKDSNCGLKMQIYPVDKSLKKYIEFIVAVMCFSALITSFGQSHHCFAVAYVMQGGKIKN